MVVCDRQELNDRDVAPTHVDSSSPLIGALLYQWEVPAPLVRRPLSTTELIHQSWPHQIPFRVSNLSARCFNLSHESAALSCGFSPALGLSASEQRFTCLCRKAQFRAPQLTGFRFLGRLDFRVGLLCSLLAAEGSHLQILPATRALGC